MRTEYLDKFMVTLSPYVRAHIESMMTDKTAPLSHVELDRLMGELALSYAQVMMQLRRQTTMVDSEAHNDTIKEIYMDLYRLFADYTRVDRALYDHHRLNASALRDVAKRLETLEKRVASLAVTVHGSEGYRVGVPLSFVSRASEKALYVLPSGEQVDERSVCQLDGLTGELTLPVVSSLSRTLSSSGARLATAVVRRKPAGAMGTPEHGILCAIDGSDSTFFGEVVLSDLPLGGDGFAGKFAVPVPGACSTFEIVFDRPTYVSEVALKPYTEYPIDIVRIRAYAGLEIDAPYIDVVPSPTAIDGMPSLSGPTVFRFRRVKTQRLQFDIAQRHFTRNVYTLHMDEVRQGELWSTIGSYELGNLGGTYQNQDAVADDNGVAIYKDALEFWERELLAKHGMSASDLVADSTISMLPDENVRLFADAALALRRYKDSSSSSADRNETIQVAKYEYTYGFYEIVPRDVVYKSAGVWVSASIPVEHNIRSLRLAVEDEQAEKEIDGELVPITAAEWYVKVTQSWIPILPENEAYVRCELLNVGPDGTAETRFTPGSVRWVREQGVKITGYSVSGNTVTITTPKPGLVYTISYVPASDCHTLDLLVNPSPVPVVDKFPSVPASRIVQLSRYPYVNYARINAEYLAGGTFNTVDDPIRVSLRGDLSSIGCGLSEVTMKTNPKLANKTDYTGSGMDTLMTFQEAGEIQFLHDGNTLAFAQELPAELLVEYQTLVSDLRVKLILRRILPDELGATHVVKSCVVKERLFGIQ